MEENQELIERYHRAKSIFFMKMASFVSWSVIGFICGISQTGAGHWTLRLFALAFPVGILIFSAIEWTIGIARALNVFTPYYITRLEHPRAFWLHISRQVLFGAALLAACIYDWLVLS